MGSDSLLPLVGVPVLSFEVGICDDCGLGEAGLETGCACWRASCAVRSARAVSMIVVLATCDTLKYKVRSRTGVNIWLVSLFSGVSRLERCGVSLDPIGHVWGERTVLRPFTRVR